MQKGMNSMDSAMKTLNLMELEAVKKRYPNVPYPVATKHSDRTANGLPKGIIAFLRLSGHQAERISEIRTFKIDRSYQENRRYFLFLNSIGGYDTLCATGDQEDSLEYTRTESVKTLPIGFEYMDHERATDQVIEAITYKANTGWINRESLTWIRDLFLSRKVFQIKGDKLMAVVISTTKVLQRVDKVDLFNIEFEYSRSYESEFYSREIVYAGYTDDFANDYPNE